MAVDLCQKQGGIMSYFVQTNASQHTGENLELTMRLGFALSVAMSSQLTNTVRRSVALEAVQCIEECQKSHRVYDMTVDGEHEFYAGGILVHNCMDAIRYAIGPLIKRESQPMLFMPSRYR